MSGIAAHDAFAAVHALAEELAQTVGVAQALAESGRVIELTGLDERIGLLCAKSLDLPSADGRRLRPHLIVLSAAIEALSRVLSERDAPSG
jgi:hypothetical protein